MMRIFKYDADSQRATPLPGGERSDRACAIRVRGTVFERWYRPPLCPENQLQALLAGGCHKQPPAVEVRPNFPQGRETAGEHGPLRVFLDPNS